MICYSKKGWAFLECMASNLDYDVIEGGWALLYLKSCCIYIGKVFCENAYDNHSSLTLVLALSTLGSLGTLGALGTMGTMVTLSTLGTWVALLS